MARGRTGGEDGVGQGGREAEVREEGGEGGTKVQSGEASIDDRWQWMLVCKWPNCSDTVPGGLLCLRPRRQD